jgi:hypothetical protein
MNNFIDLTADSPPSTQVRRDKQARLELKRQQQQQQQAYQSAPNNGGFIDLTGDSSPVPAKSIPQITSFYSKKPVVQAVSYSQSTTNPTGNSDCFDAITSSLFIVLYVLLYRLISLLSTCLYKLWKVL